MRSTTRAEDPDRDRPRNRSAVARKALALHFFLPNYLASWRRLGFDDDDFAHGGSDRLVDGLVAWGSPIAVTARVHAQFDAVTVITILRERGRVKNEACEAQPTADAAAVLG